MDFQLPVRRGSVFLQMLVLLLIALSSVSLS